MRVSFAAASATALVVGALGGLLVAWRRRLFKDEGKMRSSIPKRPCRLRVAPSEDLLIELKLRGVDVDESSLLFVEPPPGMENATCATYVALHYYRFAKLPRAMDTALLLPSHPEVDRKGRPYVNTLAIMRVPALTKRLVESMASRIRPLAPTVIVAFETRAMAFGAVLAYHCGCAFVPARKEHDTVGVDVLEEVVDDLDSYRDTCHLAIDGEPFVEGDRVVIVDDVVSSGATIRALRTLIRKCGVDVVGDVSLVNFSEPSAGIVYPPHHARSIPSSRK